ncbi:MAG: DUF5721 family protein [Clostridiales bacterium]|nr:DUF5721 family protein [Clostridiales bacterium]
MIALQITEIGSLMNQMLKGNMFDSFLLKEASVSQAFETTIDGTIRSSFYSEEESEQLGLSGLKYIPFSHVCPHCLNLLKGSRMPDAFRFVFLLSPQNQANTINRAGCGFRPEDITGLFLNLIYKNNSLVCTTGISYRVFSMNKSLEAEWDRMVRAFFRKHGIAVSEL